MNGKLIKVIGVGASIIGAVATVAGNWATSKETDNKITEKVAEAVAEAGALSMRETISSEAFFAICSIVIRFICCIPRHYHNTK